MIIGSEAHCVRNTCRGRCSGRLSDQSCRWASHEHSKRKVHSQDASALCQQQDTCLATNCFAACGIQASPLHNSDAQPMVSHSPNLTASSLYDRGIQQLQNTLPSDVGMMAEHPENPPLSAYKTK